MRLQFKNVRLQRHDDATTEFIELALEFFFFSSKAMIRRAIHLSMELKRASQTRELPKSFRETKCIGVTPHFAHTYVRISCLKEIRQCLWITALSLAALLVKVAYRVWYCSYAAFLFLSLGCHFPSFSNIWLLFGSELPPRIALRMMLKKKQLYEREIFIDSTSTYKRVPFFKCHSQSSVRHCCVRFM